MCVAKMAGRMQVQPTSNTAEQPPAGVDDYIGLTICNAADAPIVQAGIMRPGQLTSEMPNPAFSSTPLKNCDHQERKTHGRTCARL